MTSDVGISLALTASVGLVWVASMVGWLGRLAARARRVEVSWPSVWVGMAIGYIVALIRIMWWAR